MDLVYSVALFGLAVILFKLFLLGGRMPDKPGRASEGVTSDLWCVTITGLIAFGTAYGVQFLLTMNEQAFGLKEAVLVAAVLSACFLIVRVLARRRRLPAYAAKPAPGRGVSEPSAATVVPLKSSELYDHSPGEPSLPKVA